MGLSLKPRYIGPSPKKLVLIAAAAFALVATGYEIAQHETNTAAPSTQSVKAPAPPSR